MPSQQQGSLGVSARDELKARPAENSLKSYDNRGVSGLHPFLCLRRVWQSKRLLKSKFDYSPCDII